MRTTVKGRSLVVSDADRRFIETKLRRLDRLLDERGVAAVELSIEHRRSEADSAVVEVMLSFGRRTLRSVARAATHRAAVDLVVDKLERQVVEARQRPRDRGRAVGRRSREELPDALHVEPLPGEAEPRIVKVKRFAIEPMFEEDAVSRMEELGHSFFVFVNAEDERLAVLYRRDDGDYGLIEPTVGGQYTTATPGGAVPDRAARTG
jgi:putative sigma-54 modulation protein